MDSLRASQTLWRRATATSLHSRAELANVIVIDYPVPLAHRDETHFLNHGGRVNIDGALVGWPSWLTICGQDPWLPKVASRACVPSVKTKPLRPSERVARKRMDCLFIRSAPAFTCWMALTTALKLNQQQKWVWREESVLLSLSIFPF